ncbi:MAG: hypothetical protein EP330_02285 [Deltaproteobacteria bacterium]|nr:MAG: hypothetical protein EP330_02285 [Deltaproteobacteria bacterium]
MDASQLAATCAFCDSPLELAAAEAEEPVDAVAPFQLTEAQALQRLRDHLGSQWLAPGYVRKLGRPGELKPVLVPFYVYDATARTDFSCQVGCYWYRTETYTTFENGKAVTRTRQVRETEYTPLSGTHGRTWTNHLVSASKGLPETEANQLEPFDVGAALPYDATLVAGLIAERPTVDHGEAEHTARQELAQREQQAIAGGHLPGDTYRNLQSSTRSQIDAVRLVMLPVWIAAFKLPGKGEALRMLVNGQTGEVVGAVPTSWAKVGVLIAVGLFALLGFFLCFSGCGGLVALVEG